jgi:hypothetical protein
MPTTPDGKQIFDTETTHDIAFLCSERHFFDHIYPVYMEWRKHNKSAIIFVSSGIYQDIYDKVSVYNRKKGQSDGSLNFNMVKYTPFDINDILVNNLKSRNTLIYVSSWGDYKLVYSLGYKVIMTEHGSGQLYNSSSPSYASGTGGDKTGVLAYLAPNEVTLAAFRDNNRWCQYTYSIGCPKLDKYHIKKKTKRKREHIGVSFHWNCNVVPETNSAFRYYKETLVKLSSKYKLLGHGHPRIIDELIPFYKEHGIEYTRDFNDIMNKCAVYCVDNSSTLYEFATIGPVVVLNCPLYRRNISHGLRFWEYADVGINCDLPETLGDCIESALNEPASLAIRRKEIIDILYSGNDGKSCKRVCDILVTISEKHKRSVKNSVVKRYRSNKFKFLHIWGLGVKFKDGIYETSDISIQERLDSYIKHKRLDIIVEEN